MFLCFHEYNSIETGFFAPCRTWSLYLSKTFCFRHFFFCWSKCFLTFLADTPMKTSRLTTEFMGVTITDTQIKTTVGHMGRNRKTRWIIFFGTQQKVLKRVKMINWTRADLFDFCFVLASSRAVIQVQIWIAITDFVGSTKGEQRELDKEWFLLKNQVRNVMPRENKIAVSTIVTVLLNTNFVLLKLVIIGDKTSINLERAKKHRLVELKTEQKSSKQKCE